MLEGIHAVIFDLDGTLMDSMWMWKDIDIEYLGRYGLCPPEGLDVIIEGMGFTETAEYFKKRFELPDPVEKIKEDWLVMAGEKYARRLDVEPENCLVFEDVPMGILSGKNAGMQVCAVRDEYCLDQTEKIRTLADYYIQSYDEIPEHRYEELKHHGERS